MGSVGTPILEVLDAYPPARTTPSIAMSLYVWHDADQRPPLWEVPEAFAALGPVFAAAEYSPLADTARVRYSGIHVHPQVIAENAVDPHHFRFVHHTPHSPVVLRETQEDEVWRAKVGFGRRWADGVDIPHVTDNTIEILWSGLGTSFNGEHTRDGLRVIAVCATPVDATTSDIFGTYWISVGENHDARLEQAKSALPDDIAVWDSQIYMDPPGLSPSEAAGFRKLRDWARSFYPTPTSAHA
jgi:phenylpropionate dioxygenase-like ring-hydroxylating dioxygenase large terminal subunit